MMSSASSMIAKLELPRVRTCATSRVCGAIAVVSAIRLRAISKDELLVTMLGVRIPWVRNASSTAARMGEPFS